MIKGGNLITMNNDFNVGANIKVPRKLLKHYINVGTKEAKEWELVGKGVEDSAIELNPETEEVQDITGTNESSVKGWKPTQSFDPFTIRGGSKLALILHEIWMNNTPEKLSQFEILTVYSYVGNTEKGFDADVQEGCTVNIEKIGGSAYVDMPISVTYSNNRTRGTVTFGEDKQPTFVATKAQ